MSQDDRNGSGGVLSGSRAIAKAIGVSDKTVKRQHAAGSPALFKTAAHTSPIKCRREDLDRLRRRPD